jgi:hypothetical protein
MQGNGGSTEPGAREHRLLPLLDHVPKREIHPAFDHRRSLWHLVNPEALSLAGPDQPKSLTELKRNYLFRSSGSKLEAPRRPSDRLAMVGQSPHEGSFNEYSLAMRKGVDWVAAAHHATFLYSAIEARAIIQWQINRQTEKFLEILAREIKSPSKEDSGADPEPLSDQMMQGNACHSEVTAMVIGSDFDGSRLKWRIVAGKRLKHLHFEHGHLTEVGLC